MLLINTIAIYKLCNSIDLLTRTRCKMKNKMTFSFYKTFQDIISDINSLEFYATLRCSILEYSRSKYFYVWLGPFVLSSNYAAVLAKKANSLVSRHRFY